jgi:hypothetical protein
MRFLEAVGVHHLLLAELRSVGLIHTLNFIVLDHVSSFTIVGVSGVI